MCTYNFGTSTQNTTNTKLVYKFSIKNIFIYLIGFNNKLIVCHQTYMKETNTKNSSSHEDMKYK